MNADCEFTGLDRNCASVQDTAGHSEFKSIDGDFPTFEIDQNERTDVGPSKIFLNYFFTRFSTFFHSYICATIFTKYL